MQLGCGLGCIRSWGVYAVGVYMQMGVYAVGVYMQLGCICSWGVRTVCTQLAVEGSGSGCIASRALRAASRALSCDSISCCFVCMRCFSCSSCCCCCCCCCWWARSFCCSSWRRAASAATAAAVAVAALSPAVSSSLTATESSAAAAAGCSSFTICGSPTRRHRTKVTDSRAGTFSHCGSCCCCCCCCGCCCCCCGDAGSSETRPRAASFRSKAAAAAIPLHATRTEGCRATRSTPLFKRAPTTAGSKLRSTCSSSNSGSNSSSTWQQF